MLEIAKPIALVLCLISLCAVFNTAFLGPTISLEERAWDSIVLLSLAGGICLSSGMLFRETTPNGMEPVTRTLPVRIFCWSVCVMAVLFVMAWYLETYCIFYRDLRRW